MHKTGQIIDFTLHVAAKSALPSNISIMFIGFCRVEEVITIFKM